MNECCNILVDESNESWRSDGRRFLMALESGRLVELALEAGNRGTSGLTNTWSDGALFSLLVVVEVCEEGSTLSDARSECDCVAGWLGERRDAGDAAMTSGSTVDGKIGTGGGRDGIGKSL